MTRLGPCFALVLVFALALLALGCGATRQLQAVSLSPTSADAQDSANGQVQFTATGSFNKPPSPAPLTNNDVRWCVGDSSGTCPGNISAGATVDQHGVAQCVPGFSGTATILAGKGTPAMSPDGPSQLSVFGTAQLACP